MAFRNQFGAQLGQSDVAGLLDQLHDAISMRFNPIRVTVAAQRFWLHIPLLASQGAPAHCACRAYTEPESCLPPRHSAFDGGDNAFAKIQ
jgi:hypothetical protein